MEMPSVEKTGEQILNRQIGAPFDLTEVMGEVARHYIARALEESEGNKTRAADLLGLGSYQTLSNWIEKYEINK
jgi:transcriptional regulator with PAS, ATPase and Fis domain